jgi:putative ABC transport system permease protein
VYGGSVELVISWFHDFAGDCRHAMRSLGGSRAFAAAAILTIAIGLGVNTAVFSLIYTVLLDPLPFRDPGRLVHISTTHPEFASVTVSAPDFYDWRRMATCFESMAAYTFHAAGLWTLVDDSGIAEPVQVVQASPELFPMLGVAPLVGRVYTADEEAKKVPVVLISETLWRRKFGADPHILGRKIRLVEWLVTVVGVVPQNQAEPHWTDVWMSMAFLDPALTESRKFRALEVIGRLAPGVSMRQAKTEMDRITRLLAKAHPETNSRFSASVMPLSLWTAGAVRPALLIAWTAVSLVLLLACANVAHLMLMRTVQRSREFGVRAALGAGSSRLVRMLLAENLILAFAGGALGALLAWLSLPVLLRFAPGEIPRVQSTAVPPAAFVFGAAATLLCAVLFALPAMIRLRKMDVNAVIRQSSGPSLTQRRSQFGFAVIAAEIALAFVVLTGAGLLYASFAALLNEDAGFDSRGVLVAQVMDWRHSQEEFEMRVAPALRSIPGVRAVAAANCAPMMLRSTERSRYTMRFRVTGRPYPDAWPIAQVRWTTPDYFRVLRIPLKRGRLFTPADVGKPGYIINDTLAHRFFPGQDPVGRTILYGESSTPVPIIGVVGDIRDLGLNVDPLPMLYSLFTSNNMQILVRADGVEARSLTPAIRRAFAKVSPGAPVRILLPLDDLVAESLAVRRFALGLVVVFAGLALFLTAIGIYGVMSYSLAQRASEFAIRSALGAQRGTLRWVVMRDFAPPGVAGLAAGVCLALVFGHALRTQLYKLAPADPRVLAGAAAILTTLVVVAALRPAAKAASVSPAAILRE